MKPEKVRYYGEWMPWNDAEVLVDQEIDLTRSHLDFVNQVNKTINLLLIADVAAVAVTSYGWLAHDYSWVGAAITGIVGMSALSIRVMGAISKKKFDHDLVELSAMGKILHDPDPIIDDVFKGLKKELWMRQFVNGLIPPEHPELN